MRSQNISAFALIFTCLIVMISARSCVIDDDCPFGYCGQDGDERICKCQFRCKDVQNPILVCTNASSDVTFQCNALSNACERGENVLTSEISKHNLFLYKGDCSRMPTTTFGQQAIFCENQSYCNGNGICVQDVEGGEPRCSRCMDNYTGERCEVKISASFGDNNNDNPFVSSSASSLTANGSYYAGKVSSMADNVAPYAALGALSCMLCCCFIIKYHKKRRSKKTNERNDASDESTPTPVATDGDAPNDGSMTSLQGHFDSKQDAVNDRTFDIRVAGDCTRKSVHFETTQPSQAISFVKVKINSDFSSVTDSTIV